MITTGYIWPMPTYFMGEEIRLGDWVRVYVPRLRVLSLPAPRSL